MVETDTLPVNRALANALLAEDEPAGVARLLGELTGCLAVAAKDDGLLGVAAAEAARAVAVLKDDGADA